jgi:hypothetical protein
MPAALVSTLLSRRPTVPIFLRGIVASVMLRTKAPTCFRDAQSSIFFFESRREGQPFPTNWRKRRISYNVVRVGFVTSRPGEGAV